MQKPSLPADIGSELHTQGKRDQKRKRNHFKFSRLPRHRPTTRRQKKKRGADGRWNNGTLKMTTPWSHPRPKIHTSAAPALWSVYGSNRQRIALYRIWRQAGIKAAFDQGYMLLTRASACKHGCLLAGPQVNTRIFLVLLFELRQFGGRDFCRQPTLQRGLRPCAFN